VNYAYKPNLDIPIPLLSPKAKQIQSNQAMKNIENNNNTSIELPTPMDSYYEQQITLMAYNMFYPPSNKHIYNVNLNNENNFLRESFSNPYSFNSSVIPNTPKKEIHLEKKIVINNNNNSINEIENNDDNNIELKSKNPLSLNMELIDNYNENNESPTSPLFTRSGVIDK